MPVISPLGRLRQGDFEFEPTGYVYLFGGSRDWTQDHWATTPAISKILLKVFLLRLALNPSPILLSAWIISMYHHAHLSDFKNKISDVIQIAPALIFLFTWYALCFQLQTSLVSFHYSPLLLYIWIAYFHYICSVWYMLLLSLFNFSIS